MKLVMRLGDLTGGANRMEQIIKKDMQSKRIPESNTQGAGFMGSS